MLPDQSLCRRANYNLVTPEHLRYAIKNARHLITRMGTLNVITLGCETASIMLNRASRVCILLLRKNNTAEKAYKYSCIEIVWQSSRALRNLDLSHLCPARACETYRRSGRLNGARMSDYDFVKVSAVICSEINPIRKIITEALIINMLMLVNRPIVKYV